MSNFMTDPMPKTLHPFAPYDFFEIKVSEEHIMQGTPCDDENCPIALAVYYALNENIRDEVDVTVGPDFVTISYPGPVDVNYLINDEAKLFIDNFDNPNAKTPEPFTLRMDFSFAETFACQIFDLHLMQKFGAGAVHDFYEHMKMDKEEFEDWDKIGRITRP